METNAQILEFPDRFLVNGRGRILVVDDEQSIRELLSQFLEGQGYECLVAENGARARELLGHYPCDLVISDIRMPKATGIDLLDHVHQAYPELPVILITAVADLETAVDAMKQGAVDYITKPFNLAKVAASVQHALQVRLQRLQEGQLTARLQEMLESRSWALDSALRTLDLERDMTLEALVKALDARESETRHHSLRVQALTVRLAREFTLSDEEMEGIARGSLLHDIGKIGISDSILLKPGKLTEEEWLEMRKHPVLGYEILRGIDYLEPAAELVLRHHERWDGSGYPDGLREFDIPFSARLFAVIDSYDAMTSNRPYRKARPPAAARRELAELAGKLYDPQAVEAFLAIPQDELDAVVAHIDEHHKKQSD
ncbi:MAG: response regulator [Acidobacteriota bacterium]